MATKLQETSKMKCLEDYTIGQVKEMSYEELLVLWNNIVQEKQEMDIRATIVNMLDIMSASEPMIEC